MRRYPAKKQELSEALSGLEQGELDYADGQKKLDDGQADYENGLKEQQDGEKQYEDALPDLVQGEQEYNDSLKKSAGRRGRLPGRTERIQQRAYRDSGRGAAAGRREKGTGSHRRRALFR
jgi:uncharacterized phage infection (PIP) family protein YhgE